MIVLSLFDGMSCGQLALQRAGIKVDKYYASEIDKYAIQITQKNFPNTIQLGDIKNWKIWIDNLPQIDLLIGGSPCQGFSRSGEGLNFADPRSRLFFEYVNILNYCKPKYFLLENVKMKKEWQDIITSHLDVEPIRINSALVSAQNRDRLYWTNIPGIEQPEDKNIYLKDIIESGSVDRDKAYCIDANYYKGGSLKNYIEKSRRQLVLKQSEKRLMVQEEINCMAIRGRYDNDGKIFQNQEIRYDGKTNTLTTVQKDNVLAIGNEYWRKLTPIECERLQTLPDNYTEYGTYLPKINPNKCAKQDTIAIIENNNKFYVGSNWCNNPQKECPRKNLPTGIGYEMCKNICQQNSHAEIEACKKAGKNAKGGTLYLIGHTYCCDSCKAVMNKYGINKVVIGEYPKIKISDTQRYKMLGNGWTVDVISHIFSYLKINKQAVNL